MVKNFYLTFGVKYPGTPHPCWTGATGAGWVRIMALSEDEARAVAKQFFGMAWAFVYPESRFDARDSRRFYPMGERLVLAQPINPQDGDKAYIVWGHANGEFTAPQEES